MRISNLSFQESAHVDGCANRLIMESMVQFEELDPKWLKDDDDDDDDDDDA